MLTFRPTRILGLALCMAAVTATLPGRVAAAQTGPQVTVVGHVTSYDDFTPNSVSNRSQTVRLLTLRVTGTNFAPGSIVRLAVVNTARWRVIVKASTRAQRATTTVICGHDFKTCALPNPKAGTITYRIALTPAPAVPDLVVLYRTAGDAGGQGVILR